MSHFYGYLGGGRQDKTCTGHKTTGIHATLQTYGPKLHARLWHDESTGKDMFEVRITGNHGERQIARGVFSDWPETQA